VQDFLFPMQDFLFPILMLLVLDNVNLLRD